MAASLRPCEPPFRSSRVGLHALFALALFLVACGATGLASGATGLASSDASPPERPDPPTMTGPTRLLLRFHRGIGLVASYTYDTVLPRLSSLEPAQAVAAVDERDVAEYRVARSGPSFVDLLLTEAATKRLTPQGQPLTPQGQPFERVVEEGPFVVLYDGQLLYGGQCYPTFGAAALSYPVIHVLGERGRILLRVSPAQGPWDPNDAEAIRRVDPPVLRDRFRSLGRLVEIDRAW
jgi:hypothetical protein